MAENFVAQIRFDIEDAEGLKRQLNAMWAEIAKQSKFKFSIDADSIDDVYKKLREVQKWIYSSEVPIINADKSIKDIDKMIRAVKQYQKVTREASDELERTHVRTTLASTNVLRIIQDSQYGMMGMANNIEQLFESTARLRKELGSTGAALKATFMPLVTGPMAFALIGTLAVQLEDRFNVLGRTVDWLREMFGGLNREQRQYKALLDELSNKDFAGIVERATISSLLQAQDELPEMIRNQDLNLKELRAQQVKEFSLNTTLQPGTEEAEASTKRLLALSRQIQVAEQLLKDTKQLNADVNAELARRGRTEALEGIARLAGLDLKEKEKTPKGKDDPFLLEELRIAAMPDGIQREIAAIRLNSARRRAELEKQKNLDAEQRRQAIEYIARAERIAIEKAYQESARNRQFMTFDLGAAMDEYFADLEDRQRYSVESRRIAAQAIAARGMFGLTGFNADIAAVRANEKERLARLQQEREEIEILMTSASPQWQEVYNERLRALKEEEETIHAETAHRIMEIEKQKRNAILGGAEQFFGAMSGIFSATADLQNTESRKGFNRQKAFLYGQALMDATSASIGIYRSYLTSPIPPPLNGILAATQGAMVLQQLHARAREINRMKPGGGSSSAGFTVLNSSVTGGRVFDYERRRQQQATLDHRRQTEATLAVREEMKNLSAAIGDIRVVIDDPTMGEVVKRGLKRIQKTEGSL